MLSWIKYPFFLKEIVCAQYVRWGFLQVCVSLFSCCLITLVTTIAAAHGVAVCCALRPKELLPFGACAAGLARPARNAVVVPHLYIRAHCTRARACAPATGLTCRSGGLKLSLVLGTRCDLHTRGRERIGRVISNVRLERAVEVAIADRIGGGRPWCSHNKSVDCSAGAPWAARHCML